MMKRLIPLLMVGLLLAGCQSQTASNPDVTQRVLKTDTPAPTPTDNNGPNWAPTKADGTKKFGVYFLFDRYQKEGETPVFDYDKDFMVQLDRGKKVTAGEYASGDSGSGTFRGKYRKYTVTVINNTGKPIDMGGFASFSAQDGDEQAVQVFDGKVGTSPTGQLLSGRKISWSIGFQEKSEGQVVSAQVFVDTTAFATASWS